MAHPDQTCWQTYKIGWRTLWVNLPIQSGTYTYKKGANGKFVKSGNFTPSKFSIDQIDEIINHLIDEKNKRDKKDQNDQDIDQIEDTENDTIADNISSIGL